MSVAYVIWWSLLGSYVCLITTQLITVDVFIAVNTVQLVGTKLLLLVGSVAPVALTLTQLWVYARAPALYCVVL